MKTLGLLMGTKTSFISDKYFKKNMGKLIYLDELNSKLFKYKEDVPYDYAIFCELNREQIEDIFWKNAVREFNVPWD